MNSLPHTYTCTYLIELTSCILIELLSTCLYQFLPYLYFTANSIQTNTLSSTTTTRMPIPTEVVGSLPRPQCMSSPLLFPAFQWLLKPFQDADTIDLHPPDLQKAYADYDAGKIKQDELVKAQDKAAEDSVQKMSQTGEVLLTDGEQRASSFATYPIIDTLGGAGLASNLAADGQYFVRSPSPFRGSFPPSPPPFSG